MKRLIYLFTCISLLCSCCDFEGRNMEIKRGNGLPHGFQNVPEVCSKCNGTKIVKLDAGSRVMLGVITFGLGAMVTEETCDRCQGSGVEYVIKKTMTNSMFERVRRRIKDCDF